MLVPGLVTVCERQKRFLWEKVMVPEQRCRASNNVGSLVLESLDIVTGLVLSPGVAFLVSYLPTVNLLA